MKLRCFARNCCEAKASNSSKEFSLYFSVLFSRAVIVSIEWKALQHFILYVRSRFAGVTMLMFSSCVYELVVWNYIFSQRCMYPRVSLVVLKNDVLIAGSDSAHFTM